MPFLIIGQVAGPLLLPAFQALGDAVQPGQTWIRADELMHSVNWIVIASFWMIAGTLLSLAGVFMDARLHQEAVGTGAP